MRLAPSRQSTWHVLPASTGPNDYADAASFRAERKITAPAQEVLAAVSQIAMSTPRTSVLAGSAQEGLITFVTRSRVFGFPDYTTVSVQDDTLVIYARLRFGKADLGVNAARVRQWLKGLGPLTAPL